VKSPVACGERRLRGAQPVRQRGDDVDRDAQVALDPRRLDRDRLERALAADAAGGRRVEVPPEGLGVEVLGGRLDGVRGQVRRERRLHGAEALGEEEPERELLVVPGGPHGHRDRLTVDADLERLLDGHLVPLRPAAGEPQDVSAGRGVRRQGVHYDRTIDRGLAFKRNPCKSASRPCCSCR
jgi:hypothetical protein